MRNCDGAAFCPFPLIYRGNRSRLYRFIALHGLAYRNIADPSRPNCSHTLIWSNGSSRRKRYLTGAVHIYLYSLTISSRHVRPLNITAQKKHNPFGLLANVIRHFPYFFDVNVAKPSKMRAKTKCKGERVHSLARCKPKNLRN